MRLYRFTLMFIWCVSLFGDVMYEMVTTTEGMMGMAGGETKTSVYIKDDYQRTEMVSEDQMKGEMKTILITRFDKGVIWTLDPENKEYSEIKFDEGLGAEKAKEGEEEREFATPEINVERTGKKKVLLNKECEEVIVSMKVADDEGSMDFTQAMWVTKDIEGYEEINDFSKKMTDLGLASTSLGMMRDQKSAEEFQKKIQDIGGFPLEFIMEIAMGTEEMQFSMKMHTMVTKIDKKPISQKLFEIPEGYTLQE